MLKENKYSIDFKHFKYHNFQTNSLNIHDFLVIQLGWPQMLEEIVFYFTLEEAVAQHTHNI